MSHSRGKWTVRDVEATVASVAQGCYWTIRGVGFWTAILLPALYIPMVLIGHEWFVDATNFSKLIGLHVAFLFVGQSHAGDVEQE